MKKKWEMEDGEHLATREQEMRKWTTNSRGRKRRRRRIH